MDNPIVVREHCELMHKVGSLADALWEEHGEKIAGKKGCEAIHLQSVVMAHPSFPIFMTALGCMPSLSNGATVDLWGSDDPISMAVLNVNHSQTRKSRLTGLAEKMHNPVDDMLCESLQNIHEHKEKVLASILEGKKRKRDDDEDALPAAVEPGPFGTSFPGVWSTAFLGGTIERVRERCAGDVAQVKQTKAIAKLPGLRPAYVTEHLNSLNMAEKAVCQQGGMAGRIWFGQGLVYDEIYGLLEDLSLLDKPNTKKDGVGAGQTPLAGWFNRLVQTVRSDHETKSNGAHGGSAAPTVNPSLIGNLHPTPAIELIQGHRGDHGCQSKARLSFVTGLPVQPHQLYKSIPGVEAKSLWVEVPEVILEGVGLKKAFSSVYAFKAEFDLDAADVSSDEDDSPLPEYVPDVNGISYDLPDGVATLVRLVLKRGRYVGEWCIANRDVVIPDAKNLFKQVPELVKNIKRTPHRKMKLSEEARGQFLSYQTYFNIKVQLARNVTDVDAGAEYGASPWKLGMFSACLLLWDVLWGVIIPNFLEQQWEVNADHVDRAFLLLTVLWDIRTGWKEGHVHAAAAKGHADVNLPGLSTYECAKTTEIVRRFLGRADKTNVQGVYKILVRQVFNIFTQKEKRDIKEVPNVAYCRQLFGKLPAVLGEFDPVGDCFVLTVPDNITSGYESSLCEWANVTPEQLKKILDERPAPRGGWAYSKKKSQNAAVDGGAASQGVAGADGADQQGLDVD